MRFTTGFATLMSLVALVSAAAVSDDLEKRQSAAVTLTVDPSKKTVNNFEVPAM